MEKTVTTRKPHTCDYCGETIPKGSSAIFWAHRTGRYNDNDEQIGIEYASGYLCGTNECRESEQ